MGDKFFNVIGSLIVLATVTTVLVHAGGAAEVLNYGGTALQKNLSTAMGN